MDTRAMTVVHIRVTGRVQGVGFRYYTYEAALELEICGWVRNRPDRSVEILAQGTPQNLDAFVEAVRRGPTSSRVEDVIIRPVTEEKTLSSFDIKIF